MLLSKFGQIVSVIMTIVIMVFYILLDKNLQSQKDDFLDEVEENPDKYTKL